jgi:hypothetical protein
VPFIAIAQGPSDAPDLAMYGRIRDEGLSRSRGKIRCALRPAARTAPARADSPAVVACLERIVY